MCASVSDFTQLHMGYSDVKKSRAMIAQCGGEDERNS
jgi:hypothetical protein